MIRPSTLTTAEASMPGAVACRALSRSTNNWVLGFSIFSSSRPLSLFGCFQYGIQKFQKNPLDALLIRGHAGHHLNLGVDLQSDA